jgi:hypothetical protein
MSVSLKQSYDIEYDGTANVARMDLFVDTAADLTGLTTFDTITLLQGSTAEDISTGDKYMMQTNGTWVKQPSASSSTDSYTKTEIDNMITAVYKTIMYYHKTQTSTDGTITFYALSGVIESLSIYGNGQQTETPTFCGVRTGNLVNQADIIDGYFINPAGEIVENSRRCTTPIFEISVSISLAVFLEISRVI